MCVNDRNYLQPPNESIDVENAVTESTNTDNDAKSSLATKAAAGDEQHIFKSLSPTTQFTLLAVSMIILFSIHNVLQEAIMKLPNFKYGVMLGYMEVLG